MHTLWGLREKSAESNQREAFWTFWPSRQPANHLVPLIGWSLGEGKCELLLDALPSPAPTGCSPVSQPRLAGRSGPTGPVPAGALSQGQRGRQGLEQESEVPARVAGPPCPRPRQLKRAYECQLSPCRGSCPNALLAHSRHTVNMCWNEPKHHVRNGQ